MQLGQLLDMTVITTTADHFVLPAGTPVEIGMPQLCRAGLSENWLLKACGHRHWLALAQAHGLATPDFRAVDGSRLYPAFISISLRADGWAMVREADLLAMELTLTRTGRTRFKSRIRITSNDRAIASVTMETIFVKRTIAGQNRSAARALVDAPCLLPSPPGPQSSPFRPDGWRTVMGFEHGNRRVLERLTIDPNPHEDFNGADFLYFSSFQSMLDRAEWSWFRQTDPLYATQAREIFYLGNLELGDRAIALLCGRRQEENRLAHWIELRRESDGGLMAVAFSQRKAGASAASARISDKG